MRELKSGKIKVYLMNIQMMDCIIFHLNTITMVI